MQLFVRGCGGSGTLLLEAEEHACVGELAAAYARRAHGVDRVPGLVLLHGGRRLDESAPLSACAGLAHGSTLEACARLRGGGGDGGSTGAESRSCYLEMYAERKPDKVNPAEELLARATRCRLSGERLAPPCVADELGSLYNKEALVGALLNKTMPAALAHISGLKSVVTLKLEPSAAAAQRARSGALAGPGPGSSSAAAAVAAAGNGALRGGADGSSAEFQCPVTGLEMNGRFPFVIHRPTGTVLSERALRDAPAAAEELLGGKWEASDLIPVNPAGEELERRQQAVAAALAAERARKRAKKAAKAGGGAAEGGVAEGGAAAAAVGGAAKAGIKRPPAAPGAAAAAANGDGKPKKIKLPPGATPEVYASIFSTGQPQAKETFCCRAVSGRGLRN